jgi:uncharacterized membrane protein
MSSASRLPAVLAYIPIVGWLYVFLFERQNAVAVFHLRQSIGLFLFLVGVIVGWVVIAWLLAWIPYMEILAVALFTLVIAAYMYGAVAWVLGLFNALTNRPATLPLFGQWANRLPIRQIPQQKEVLVSHV